MRSRLLHYIKVYGRFLSTGFVQALEFRVHFFLLIFMDLAFYISSLASVHIIFDHVSQIGGWNREQFLFFTTVMLCINQLTMSFISESFWRFPVLLRTGELDFYLLKPIGSIFTVFFRFIRPGSMVNVLFTGSTLIYFGLQIDLSWYSWVLLPFLIVMGFILQNSIELVITCSMFWMLEGTGINFLRMELQQLARWPDFIYSAFVYRFLSVLLPILLIGSAPVRFLFNYGDFFPMIGMAAAILVFWGILGVSWSAGLKAYESASS